MGNFIIKLLKILNLDFHAAVGSTSQLELAKLYSQKVDFKRTGTQVGMPTHT